MIAAVARYGPTVLSQGNQQWLLAWELSGWFASAVLDPCWSPPVQVYKASYEVRANFVFWGLSTATVTRHGEEWYWGSADETAWLRRYLDESGSASWKAFTLNQPGHQTSAEGWRRNTAQPAGSYGELSPTVVSLEVS